MIYPESEPNSYNMFTKRLLLTLLFCFCGFSEILAQETETPRSRADTTIAENAHFYAAVDFIEQHREVFKESILATFDLDFHTTEELVPLIPKIYEFIEEKIQWEQVTPQLAFRMMEAFTKEEIQELTEFMRTETGRKFMEFSPDLVRQYQEIGLLIALENKEELETRVMLLLDEM